MWARRSTLGEFDIYFARSTDNGVSWTAPAFLDPLATSDIGDDYAPRIATDEQGNWLVVWMTDDDREGGVSSAFDIAASRSTDGGTTWQNSILVNNGGVADEISDNAPHVATDGLGNWVVTWQSTNDLGGTIGVDIDVLFSRSTDNGATWSSDSPLNSDATADSRADQTPQIVANGQGSWVAVWSKSNGPDIDLFTTRSLDNGVSWTSPQPLNSNHATDSGNDEYPILFLDEHDTAVTVWRTTDTRGDTIGTDFDLLVSRSTDAGVSWTEPELLNTDAKFDARQDFTDGITSDDRGHWITPWVGNKAEQYPASGTDNDVHYTRWTWKFNDVYIDFGSTFNGTGASTSPLDNLTDAISMANPNATLHIAPGTTAETFTGPISMGSDGHPMTLRKNGASPIHARIGGSL